MERRDEEDYGRRSGELTGQPKEGDREGHNPQTQCVSQFFFKSILFVLFIARCPLNKD